MLTKVGRASFIRGRAAKCEAARDDGAVATVVMCHTRASLLAAERLR